MSLDLTVYAGYVGAVTCCLTIWSTAWKRRSKILVVICALFSATVVGGALGAVYWFATAYGEHALNMHGVSPERSGADSRSSNRAFAVGFAKGAAGTLLASALFSIVIVKRERWCSSVGDE